MAWRIVRYRRHRLLDTIALGPLPDFSTRDERAPKNRPSLKGRVEDCCGDGVEAGGADCRRSGSARDLLRRAPRNFAPRTERRSRRRGARNHQLRNLRRVVPRITSRDVHHRVGDHRRGRKIRDRQVLERAAAASIARCCDRRDRGNRVHPAERAGEIRTLRPQRSAGGRHGIARRPRNLPGRATCPLFLCARSRIRRRAIFQRRRLRR